MARPQKNRETTEDRPAKPASTNRAAPFATQETQVSNTMLDATGSEPEITTADTQMADTIASHLVTAGLACGQTHAQIVQAVLSILADVRAEIARSTAGGAR